MSDFGNVIFNWVDGTYDIRFSYKAIDAIEKKFGDDWSERLRDLFVGKSKQDLEFVVSVTTDVSSELVAEDSPPIVPLVNALYRAWQLAWHGEEQVPGNAEVPQADEKKLRHFLKFWRARSNSGSD